MQNQVIRLILSGRERRSEAMKKNKKNPTAATQSAKVDAIAERLRVRTERVKDARGYRVSPSPLRGAPVSHSSGETLAEPVTQSILERYEWKEVHAPKAWYPKMPGTELVGFYGGRTTRSGFHGQYDVIIVHVPTKGSFMVSGAKLMQLVDAAMIDIGHPIRIVWEGHQSVGVTDTGEEKRMKLFRVLVAEGEPISAADLPRVSQ